MKMTSSKLHEAVGFVLFLFAVSECREMCYTCSYNINPLDQGVECVYEPKNVTLGQWASQCPYKCLITSEITIETMEIRSFNRMCGFTNGEDRCEVHGPYEICYHTCEADFCNDGIMGLLLGALEEENGAPDNVPLHYLVLLLSILGYFLG